MRHRFLAAGAPSAAGGSVLPAADATPAGQADQGRLFLVADEVNVSVESDNDDSPETPAVVVVTTDSGEGESQEEIEREIETAVTLERLAQDVSEIRGELLKRPTRDEVREIMSVVEAEATAESAIVAEEVAEETVEEIAEEAAEVLDDEDVAPTTQRRHWLFRTLPEWRDYYRDRKRG